MPRSPFDPCIPTKAPKVPDRPEWLHEIKHDGYRLIVQRDGKRVRLWTRNGHDWSDRFPLIAEAALRNRNASFVIDGEAVLLDVDGRSDFNGLHSRKHDAEVEFYAFDCLVSDSEDLRRLPLSWSVHDNLVHHFLYCTTFRIPRRNRISGSTADRGVG
jgi:ATP-dependent DNA ligase